MAGAGWQGQAGRGEMAGVGWQGWYGRGRTAEVEWQAIHDKDTPQQQTRQEAVEEVGQGSRSSAPLPWQ